jgi:hypothetical protein
MHALCYFSYPLQTADGQTLTVRPGQGVDTVCPTVTLSDGHRLTINGFMRFAISFTRCKQPRSDRDGADRDTVWTRCKHCMPTVTLSDGHRLTIKGCMRFAISFTRCKQPSVRRSPSDNKWMHALCYFFYPLQTAVGWILTARPGHGVDKVCIPYAPP